MLRCFGCRQVIRHAYYDILPPGPNMGVGGKGRHFIKKNLGLNNSLAIMYIIYNTAFSDVVLYLP